MCKNICYCVKYLVILCTSWRKKLPVKLLISMSFAFEKKKLSGLYNLWKKKPFFLSLIVHTRFELTLYICIFINFHFTEKTLLALIWNRKSLYSLYLIIIAPKKDELILQMAKTLICRLLNIFHILHSEIGNQL